MNAVFGSMDSGNSATQAVQSGQSVLSFNTAAQEAGSNAGNLLNAVASGRNVDAAINNQVGGTANSQDVQAFSKAVGDRLADGGSTNDAIGQGSQAVQTATQSRQEADNADPTLKAVAQGTDPSNGQGGESFNQALGQALNNGEAPAQAVSQAETAQETTNQEQAVAGTAEAAQPQGTTPPDGEPATGPTVVADAGTAAGGAGADGAPVDGTPADGTPTDGTPTDGTPTDGTPTDGTPTDGTPADGTPADGTPTDGAPVDGTPADGQPTDGTPTDGTPTDGTPTDGTPTDGEPTDGTPADGQPTDGTPADGTPADGTPTDGQPTDGTPADGTPTDGQPTDGTPTDGEPTDGTPVDGEPTDGTPADGTPTDGTPTDGQPTDGTPTDGTDQNNGPVVTTLQVSDPLSSNGQIGETGTGFNTGTGTEAFGLPGTGLNTGPTDPTGPLLSPLNSFGPTAGGPGTGPITNGPSDSDTDTTTVILTPVTPETPATLSVSNDAETMAEGGASIGGNLLANDSSSGTLSISSPTGSFAGSNGGLFTLSSDGSWTFDPGQDFAALTTGDSAQTEIIVTVSSSEGLSEDQTLTITVTGQDDGSVAVNDSVSVAEGGTSTTLNVLANDTDVDGFASRSVETYSNDAGTVATPGNPIAGNNGGLFSIAADGTVTFTAGSDFESLTAGQSAQTSITYTLLDNSGNRSSATVTATVTGASDASVAVADSLSVSEGGTSVNVVNVFTNDTDPDGTTSHTLASYTNGTSTATVAGTIIAGSNGGAFSIDASGNVIFDSGLDFETLTAGQTAQTSITYTLIDDAGNQSAATVTATVNGVNSATVAVDDVLSVNEDSTSTGVLNVFDNDIDFDGSSGRSIVSYTNGLTTTSAVGTAIAGSNGGLFTITAAGLVTFDTNAEFDSLPAGQTFETAITYTMTDDSGIESAAIVTATVTGVDDPVVAVGDVFFITEDLGSGVIGNVLTNDTDPDGIAGSTVTSYTNGGGSALAGFDIAGDNGGIFNIAADGSVTFNTNGEFDRLLPNTSEPSNVTYTVTDANGNTSTATVSVTISGVNDAPTTTGNHALGTFTKTTTTTTFQITEAQLLANFSDAENDTLSVQNLSLATGSTGLGTINQTSATTWDYTPVGGADASVSFTYDVSDGTTTTQGTASVNQTTTAAAVTSLVAEAGLRGDVTGSQNMTDFTIEFWMRPNAVPTSHANLLTFTDGANHNYNLTYRTNGALFSQISDGGGNTHQGTITTMTDTNTWYHVAIRFDSANLGHFDTFINGVEENVANGSSGSTNPYSSFTGNLAINLFAGANSAEIDIAELRIWNDQRTNTEITDNKDIQIDENSAGLVAYYRFAGGDSSTTSNLATSSYGSMNFTADSGGGPWLATMPANDGPTLKFRDPLVFDLDRDGLELLGLEAGVQFDMNGDGEATPTGWFGPNEGLLVSDLNQNGRIDSLMEVISPAFNPDGRNDAALAQSIEVLALYDDDANGLIDAADAIFASLSIWQDANSNGVTDDGELLSLESIGLTEIGLPTQEEKAAQTPETDTNGNVVELQGTADTEEGDALYWYQVAFVAGSESSDQEGYTSSGGNDQNSVVEDQLSTISV
ncbi:MAG: beta strand repeat-containing protein [Rhodospirillaceae bacterium]